MTLILNYGVKVLEPSISEEHLRPQNHSWIAGMLKIYGGISSSETRRIVFAIH
jgi:hypothetical protein